MCGLAGIIAWGERVRIDRATLAAMSARIAHRGPDGQGLLLNHDGAASPIRPQVGLVHRRLAILDPDPRADQPFTSPDGKSWIVFNGEIYNYRELRRELEQARPDWPWCTSGDTEVLLAAYLAWGEKCLDRLNGMYAFAVWDDARRELFLARDRMGQKPLYYAILPNGAMQSIGVTGAEPRAAVPVSAVAFASELGALAAVPWVGRQTNPDALAAYLCWGYIPSPRTIYRGAVKLPPATWLKVSYKRTEMGRYFDPNEPGARVSPPALESHAAEDSRAPGGPTRRLLVQAVKRQLVSDVPLGCFLSGGIDSSIIAAAMKACAGPGQPVLTFAIGFEDPRYDETPYAAAVAEHLGTKHRSFIVRPDAAHDLPKLAAVYGEPFADSSALPTHYLARETRQYVKVALSGDGGDELFGGYDRYRAMALAERIGRWPGFVRRMIASRLWQRLPGSDPKSRLTRVKRFLATLREPAAQRYSGYVRMFDEAWLGALVHPDFAPAISTSSAWLANRYAELNGDADAVRTSAALDRVTYLPEDLLTKVDRASMLHALEVRSPFMDHELVGFAGGLSGAEMIGGGTKQLLRRAFAADLPEEVFRRRKMGFAVPIGEWFRSILRPMLHDLLFAADSFASAHFNRPAIDALIEQHQHRRVDHTQRLYALLMLELWWGGVKRET